MDSQATFLDYTGERMVPEKAADVTFWEHIYRYRFATQFVKGKRVLDIACGEGYGSAALQKAGAANVIGVDISEEACTHARRKYSIDARVGDAEAIPLEDNSVDVVVSFETIEHVNEPARFVDECARVLTKDGMAIISTPNVEIYHIHSPDNPFHSSEMSEEEFVELLKSRFEHCTLYSQRSQRAAWWSLRGLSSETWPLLYVSGLGRLGNRLRTIYGERSINRNTNRFRSKPVTAIGHTDKPLSGLFNSYQVRRHQPFHQEEPTYLIAVVSHPK